MNTKHNLELSGKTILVVDDDNRNTFALVSYLETLNTNILTSEDGFNAIRMLEQSSDIDIVLMDMMMPEMDGYETIKKIREMPLQKNIPIISVTAKAMKGDREKCLEAGASEYISKPVDLNELYNKMLNVIDQ